MDEIVANWILEFLIRKQSIDDKIINGVLESLPLSENNRLKKTIVLRRIESEILTGSFSEKLLELLEILEELDHGEGKTSSDSLKEAYCAVAVDCTVRFLEQNVVENIEYFEAVERVWRNRLCLMETFLSEESSRWLGDIEAAVRDSSVVEKILSRNTRNEALKAVGRYLEEGWKSLGPTVLEFVASKVGDKVEELHLGGGGGGDVGGDGVSSDNPRGEVVSCQGIQKRPAISRRKHVATKTKRPRGAKIYDSDEDPEGSMNTSNDVSIHKTDKVQEKFNVASGSLPDAAHAHNFPLTTGNDDNDVRSHSTGKVQEASESCSVRESQPEASRAAHILSSTKMTCNSSSASVLENQTRPVLHSTPEVTRVREALKSSVKELHAAVKDPLPETLQIEETLCSTGAATNPNTAVENQTRAETLVAPEVGPVHQNLETNSMEMLAPARKRSPVDDVSSKRTTRSMRKDACKNQIQPDIQTPMEFTENNPENVKDEFIEDAQGHEIHDVGNSLENARKKDKSIEDAQGHEIHDAGNNFENARQKDTLIGDAQSQPNRKRSLMEPNDTGHTFEWEDSIDNTSGSERVTLSPTPTSSRRKVDPFHPYVSKHLSRRLMKKWTPNEEETLRDAVKKFGRRWKFILEHYSDAFLDRTDVDLKDKWRNMVKYSQPGPGRQGLL